MADGPSKRGANRERVRLFALGALAVLALLIAVLNSEKVKVDLIFGSGKIPLILVIIGCLVAGAAIDRLLLRWRHRRG
jgi:uncharacterized integral membrane protein